MLDASLHEERRDPAAELGIEEPELAGPASIDMHLGNGDLESRDRATGGRALVRVRCDQVRQMHHHGITHQEGLEAHLAVVEVLEVGAALVGPPLRDKVHGA